MSTTPAALFGARASSRDKRLIFACIAMVAIVAVVIAILAPREDDNDPVPSSYATTSHGAEAAYIALGEAGYHMERWERPLAELAAQADSHTVLIVAEPSTVDAETQNAVKTILGHGGRVLATGLSGAALLPGNHAELNNNFAANNECAAQPEGFDPLAGSGTLHMRPLAYWKMIEPDQHAQYYCGSSAVVVTYSVGPGAAIWWANSMPLENASIGHDGDLALLLASLGPRDGARIIWDESLHEGGAGLWTYAKGTPVHLLWTQLAILVILLLLSFARRSGPLLPDPLIRRDQPLEFVSSLGALYDKAGASSTAVKAAFDRFRLSLGRAGALDELVSVANARIGHKLNDLRETLGECAESEHTAAGSLSPTHALHLVQKLWEYELEVRGTNEIANAPDHGRKSTT